MHSSFVRAKPLQALKLTAVVGTVVLAGVGMAGILPRGEVTGLLLLLFTPVLITVAVTVEALLTGVRLVRADNLAARLTAHYKYTLIRTIELIVTVLGPGAFCLFVYQNGDEFRGDVPTLGLAFIGVFLGIAACAVVLLRTLTEYYIHRKQSGRSKTNTRGGNTTE